MKQPLKNLGAMLVSDAGSRLIGFLITAYLARVLAPSAFGVLSIGLAVLGLLVVLGSPGMQVVEARNVAARTGGLVERVGGVLVVRLVIAFVLIALTWIVTAVVVESAAVRDVIRLYAASLVPYALLLDWYFQGKEDFFRLGASRFLTYVMYGVAVVLFVRSAGDLRMAPVALLTGNIVATVFLAVAYARQVPQATVGWNPELWTAVLRENVPVGVALLLAQVVSNFPALVVGFFMEARDVGMYSAAVKLVYLLLIVDRLFGALFLPVVARYFATREGDVGFLMSVTLKGLLIILLPVVGLGFVLAGPAVALVFGPGYGEAAPLLRIMTGFVALTVLNTVFVCALIGSKREQRYVNSMALGTGILVVAVMVLTPVFGTVGASAALLVGEAATLGLMMRQARAVTALPSAVVAVRPLAAFGVMAVLLWIIPSTALACVAGTAAYIGVIAVSSALNGEEIRYLRERFI